MKLNDIIKEIKLDRSIDHLSKIKQSQIKKETYNFNIRGTEYQLTMLTDNILNIGTVLSINFINISELEKLKNRPIDKSVEQYYSEIEQAKYGLTKSGSSILVFNEIYNVLSKYIEQSPPDYIRFEAIEKNRKKLYKRLVERSAKELNLDIKKSLFDPINNVTLSNKSQVQVYKINND